MGTMEAEVGAEEAAVVRAATAAAVVAVVVVRVATAAVRVAVAVARVATAAARAEVEEKAGVTAVVVGFAAECECPSYSQSQAEEVVEAVGSHSGV
jgi:hypothetical protein